MFSPEPIAPIAADAEPPLEVRPKAVSHQVDLSLRIEAWQAQHAAATELVKLFGGKGLGRERLLE